MFHDRLYRLILALDDAQWEEKEHPRDKGGQFSSGGGVAKKSQVSPHAIATPLSAHGFQIEPGGEAKYTHPSGHKIHVKPLPEGQKFYSSVWHDPNSGQGGTGGVSLKKHLASLGLSATAAASSEVKEPGVEPKAKTPKEPKPAPTFEHPKEQYAQVISAHGGVPVKETEASQHYKFPNGSLMVIRKNPGSAYSSHVRFAITSPTGQIYKGKGYGTLKYYLEKTEGALAQPAPTAPTPIASGPAAYQKAAEKVTAAGFKDTGSPTTIDGSSGWKRYVKGGDNENLQESIAIHPETGNFRIWAAGLALAGKPGAEMAGNGYAIKGTAEQFDAAFESLHPRGPGGQFAKKPSEVLPAKHQDMASILESFSAETTSVSSSTLQFKVKTQSGDITVSTNPNSDFSTGALYKNNQLIGQFWDSQQLNNYLNVHGAVITTPPQVAKPPINTGALTKTGPQLGSNPGGQYEDPSTGQKFYVKQTQSEDHAKNENLAAALYGLAGTNTLSYRKSEDDPKAVVTEMVPLVANNVSGLTPEQRKRARVDFATHVWTANWDAAGLTGDNVGVIKGGPGEPDRVATLDVGGALAYRAKGSPKAHLFGNDVPEWETLRDQYKNPSSAALFKDMTQQELTASVAKVAAVKDAQIREAVKEAGYEGTAAEGLANKLIARRDALAQKMNSELNKPPPPPAWSPPFEMAPFSSSKMQELNSAAPPTTSAEHSAVKSYTGGGYQDMNRKLRYGYVAGGNSNINNLSKWLDKASMPEDVTVSRRVSADYAEFLKDVASHPGAVFTDLGFASTSLSPGTWSGNVQMIVRVPKGAKAAAVQHISSHSSEYEIVVQRGSHYRVVAYDKKTHTIYCDLDQTHLVKELSNAA